VAGLIGIKVAPELTTHRPQHTRLTRPEATRRKTPGTKAARNARLEDARPAAFGSCADPHPGEPRVLQDHFARALTTRISQIGSSQRKHPSTTTLRQGSRFLFEEPSELVTPAGPRSHGDVNASLRLPWLGT